MVQWVAWVVIGLATAASVTGADPESVAEVTTRSPDALVTAKAELRGIERTGRVRQDPRDIPRLKWTSPHGELPGTYAEYLRRHPLETARYLPERTMPAAPPARGVEPVILSILVDADLQPLISVALDEYVADLSAEGYTVRVGSVSGGTPAEIKGWVAGQHATGSDGVIFIGDITAAWAEVSESVFPSDLFYMDLDGLWADEDGDGDFEVHEAGAGDEGPEIYVARMYAHTLDYDTEANMVSAYLAKAHAYRTGTLTQPWRGLEYVDEDWYSMSVDLEQVYGGDVARYDLGFSTTAADYLEKMDIGQHFVQVCAHSYSGGHHFGQRPTEAAAYAHVYVHSPTARAAKLLVGSDDGIKVWLNGANVLTEDVYQGWIADQFDVDVTLDEGWNSLLCKVSQAGGSYGFSARVTDPAYSSFSDLTYQVNDPTVFVSQEQFIRGWLLNGFHEDISDNFWSYLTTNYLGTDEDRINPTAGDVMGGQTWTLYTTDSGYVNMDPGDELSFGASYAFTRVYAVEATSCQLWLGYDEGARVWLNGAVVLTDNRYGDFELDLAKIDVNLTAGENRLLIKVSEWVGPHGLAAQFRQADGGAVAGLTYDPDPPPISFIADWLINGPYGNVDDATRLSQDYLGDEATVTPSEGDPAAFEVWNRLFATGAPVDLVAPLERDGGWVTSADIQQQDPPVLFYNLFACGPGRFTDDNYLAGSYIFNTTYGLITIASSKSGSMLNFADFTAPLGEGKTIGTAFLEWFDAQAPFDLWEREWYYGMVLNGDPTLRPVKAGDLDRDGDVDADDFDSFVMCFTGTGGGPIAPECAPGDSDSDGDVDCDDWTQFELSWTEAGDPPTLAVCDVAAPLPAPAPHDGPKNRYVSFAPAAGENLAFRVELTQSALFPDSTGPVGWVGAPDAEGLALLISEPYYTDSWPAVVHAGGCAVTPAATYRIRATDGVGESDPLDVATAAAPTPKHWADCVGEFVGSWGPPNGLVNVNDLMAAIQKFQALPTAPHSSWVDVDGETPNQVVNMTDVQQILNGYKGSPYPFSAPADCP